MDNIRCSLSQRWRICRTDWHQTLLSMQGAVCSVMLSGSRSSSNVHNWVRLGLPLLCYHLFIGAWPYSDRDPSVTTWSVSQELLASRTSSWRSIATRLFPESLSGTVYLVLSLNQGLLLLLYIISELLTYPQFKTTFLVLLSMHYVHVNAKTTIANEFG